jgi:MutS domain V
MDSGAQPREIYAERLDSRKAAVKAFQDRASRLGLFRLLIFALGALLLWCVFQGAIRWWWLFAPLAAFIGLIVLQSRADRKAEFAGRAVRYYERGIARLENRWTGFMPGDGVAGERFSDPHHPYADDLDLFGRASLFELLSTARTRAGEARLASWLKAPAPPGELRARHQSVEELRPLLDLREQLAVLGDDFRTGVHHEELIAWASAPRVPFPRWGRPFALICSLAAFASLVWFFYTSFLYPPARIALLMSGLLVLAFGFPMRLRILGIIEELEEPAHDLDLLSLILAKLETQEFKTPRLVELSKTLSTQGHPASARIAKLRSITDMVESRENPIIRAIGPLVLWTTQLGMAVEAWRTENGPYIAGWLEAVSEIEALSSIANYSFEHPNDPFPTFEESSTAFEAKELGHPLLPETQCIRNSVSLCPPLQLLIVSGSNMSGKSTLLRSIGINSVLAFAGAPVRARSLTLSPLSLGASIRATDSLEEGHSRFMAEILRLKQILDLPKPALFLLDELLGGTNSHDRALGSEGLIRALLDRGAIGLVTTHDLSLAQVATALGERAANVHFEDRLENGRLIFDYKMREGVVTRSNALDLMRAVGLEV